MKPVSFIEVSFFSSHDWSINSLLIIRLFVPCYIRTCHVTSGRIYITAWYFPLWGHRMETFSTLLVICAGNSPVTSEFPAQRPVARSFSVFFDLHLNKRLSKQLWGWWFETPSGPLWRHSSALYCTLAFHSAVHEFVYLSVILSRSFLYTCIP